MKKWYGLLALSFCFSCSPESDGPSDSSRDYRQSMRDFVIGISQYAKSIKPGFIVIPQNGIELVASGNEDAENPSLPYLNAIDGNGQEDLNFGYDQDNVATPLSVVNYLKPYLNLSKSHGKTILVTDYCWDADKVNASISKNSANGYLSFAAPQRDLNTIPDGPVQYENSTSILQLSDAKNFLYLINAESFSTKTAFINAVRATNYDAVIMDLYFNDGTAFTAQEIESMQVKANGAKRLLICYMSIGEAEDYRYYWQTAWNSAKPDWMEAQNPDWPGNYKVQYWNPDWQQLIYGNDSSYLKKITDAHFDGVYLDIIDAFEYFE